MLELFSKFSENHLPHARKTHLSIYGAFHASHVHSSNIASIMGNSPLLELPLSPNTSVISTSSGRAMDGAQTMRDLLHDSLLDILRRPLDVPKVVEELKACELVEPMLTIIGPSNMTNSLQRSLKWSGHHWPVEPGIKSKADADCQNSGCFAIVGMSGRFPGGEDLESFWNVLEEGLDLHRKVKLPAP